MFMHDKNYTALHCGDTINTKQGVFVIKSFVAPDDSRGYGACVKVRSVKGAECEIRLLLSGAELSREKTARK